MSKDKVKRSDGGVRRLERSPILTISISKAQASVVVLVPVLTQRQMFVGNDVGRCGAPAGNVLIGRESVDGPYASTVDGRRF